jgi:prepilin-type N-terminal cleavage/methylation domain-containing protein
MKMKRNGFTLIEILVVMSIVALISVFGLSFLSTILKGSSKTNIISELKQNGNYVLDVMSYYIRNSVSIDSCAGSSITLRQWDNTTVTFTKINQDDVNKINSKIASNSSSLTNSDSVSGVSVASLNFTCDSSKPPVVNIDFSLTQSAWAQNSAEFTGSVPFSTTVSLRTY